MKQASSTKSHQNDVDAEIFELPEWFIERLKFNKDKAKSVITVRKTNVQTQVLTDNQIISDNTRKNESGRDPLTIFPEEIWTMIFQQVVDAVDVLRISSASTLFSRILNRSKYLFEKVFPLIYHHLPKPSILKCRQVCKRWCLGVDTFLENFYTVLDTPIKSRLSIVFRNLNTFRTFKFKYGFVIHPFEHKRDERFPNSVNYNEYHLKNPFLGRYVTITLDQEEREEGKFENFSTPLNTLLVNLGQHIWYLDLISGDEFEFDSVIDCYSTCQTILHNCPNLRKFHLGGKTRDADHWILARSFPGDLPQHKNLQELCISIQDSAYNLLPLQNRFAKMYSNQLKRLQVETWNDLTFDSYPWSSLKDLHVTVDSTNRNRIFQSLLHLKADNLLELTIKWDKMYDDTWRRPKANAKYLQKLIHVSNHFPKLNRLKTEMQNEFVETHDEEIVALPKYFSCCVSVTRLEANVRHLTDSLNFLICFPSLERLTLLYEGLGLTENGIDRDSKGFINVAKYLFRDNRALIYKSNIWEILPSLKRLEVGFYGDWTPLENMYVYTKEAYEYYEGH